MRGVLLILMFLAWSAQSVRAATDAERNDAIQRIQNYLLSQQDPQSGGWMQSFKTSSKHHGGEAALVTYALLRSGMSVQEPRMRAAVEYLKNVRMRSTYAISLRAHCWAALSEDYRSQLSADARWLLAAQVDGLFTYGPRTGPQYDHSVTQYGLLGLWESSKRRGPTASRVWHQSSQHFIDTQNLDGGWGYKNNRSSDPSMTAAGLTALLIAQENIYRHKNKPPAKLTDAINGGIIWLDRYTSQSGATVGESLYYLVSLERAALASGIRTLGGRDWFQEGTQSIISAERGTGSLDDDLVDTAFALLFLSRGGVPTWANKLRLHGQTWNNRPNDLSMLTRRLGDQVEAELGWYVIDASSDTSLWLDAPVAYVASDGPVLFSELELANLEIYLDLGGILVATPDAHPEAFAESIRSAAAKIYPEYVFQRVDADHPLMGLVHQVDLPEDKRPWVLSNGVRDLIVLAPTDWGMAFQAKRTGMDSAADMIMANLYALVTERGWETDGIIAFDNEPDDKPVARTLQVFRAFDQDQHPVEPLAWYPLGDPFFNRTGYKLKVHGVSFGHVDEIQTSLLYMGGVHAQRLSAEELRRLVRHINRGGTILIETIGGRGAYADEMLQQLEAVLGERAVPLDTEHPIITGKGLAGPPDAGYDMRRVTYRRYSTLNRGPVSSPRLLSINVNGRDVVIASLEDFSMGVLGSRRWGVDGYDVDSARSLLTNILLYTVGDQAVSPEPTPPDDPGHGQGTIIEQ